MARNRKPREVFELDEISVEIGHAVSKDGGLLAVTREIRRSGWFPALVDGMLEAMSGTDKPTLGFTVRAKLEAGLVALVAGLTLGRRNPNAIAQSFALDPLWLAVVGRSFGQKELSRLMAVLSEFGHEPLRKALLASALAGQTSLQLDLDSSLLELHGTQELGAYNAHYHAFGYHAGWAVDVRTQRIAALWLNEGKANTAQGQDEQMAWVLDQGADVSLARFDAGLIGPKLLGAMAGRVERFVCRIRPNDTLARLADPIEPEGALYAGARAYGEIRYGAGSWTKDERVVVKFQAPDGAEGQAALVAERFYFVTSLEDAPADVVRTYQQRGESERMFGEFVATFQPTFRHAEVKKNEVWALLLGLAHNVLSDLREQLPKAGKPRRQRVEHRPAFLPDQWVFGYQRVLLDAMDTVRPLLARVRDMALRVPCELRQRGRRLLLAVSPDILAPAWFPALMRA